MTVKGRLYHLQLNVRAPGRSLPFYRELFGYLEYRTLYDEGGVAGWSDGAADGDGEVVNGSDFANVGGGEVDGQALGREIVIAVQQGGAHPFEAFAHGGVGQTDEGHPPRHPLRHVHFDRNRHCVQPDDRATRNGCQHKFPLSGARKME